MSLLALAEAMSFLACKIIGYKPMPIQDRHSAPHA